MKTYTKILFIAILVTNIVYCISAPQNRQSATRPRASTTTTTPKPALVIQEHSTKDDQDALNAKTMNPVARLYLIQSRRQQMEPVFKEVGQKNYRNQKNHIIRREFEIQAKVGDKTSTGTGYSKKDAKRNAAITLLRQMGFEVEV